MGEETKQSRIVKVLDSLGKEASILKISKLTNLKYTSARQMLSILFQKGLVKRRRDYARINNKTTHTAYYRINKDTPASARQVSYWVKHY